MSVLRMEKRRKFQFHLSTALVLLLVVGLLIPTLGYCYRRYCRNDSVISVSCWDNARILSLRCIVTDKLGPLTFEHTATSNKNQNIELKVPACVDAELTVVWEQNGKSFTDTIICSTEPDDPAEVLCDDGKLSKVIWSKCQ